MRPLAGSARALHRIRSGDEVTDVGRRRIQTGSAAEPGVKCKSNRRRTVFGEWEPPRVRCNDSQIVTQGGSLPLPLYCVESGVDPRSEAGTPCPYYDTPPQRGRWFDQSGADLRDAGESRV